MSKETRTQSSDVDVLDVTPQDGLEVGDEVDTAHVSRAVCEDDNPIT